MINSITLVGRLCADPEMTRTSGGLSIAAMRVAVDDRKGPNGERSTLFIDCRAYAASADFVMKNFRKGDPIAVFGKLLSRKYNNKQGTPVTVMYVSCDRVEFGTIGKAEKPEQPQQSAPQIAQTPQKSPNFDDIVPTEDDLPF